LAEHPQIQSLYDEIRNLHGKLFNELLGFLQNSELSHDHPFVTRVFAKQVEAIYTVLTPYDKFPFLEELLEISIGLKGVIIYKRLIAENYLNLRQHIIDLSKITHVQVDKIGIVEARLIAIVNYYKEIAKVIIEYDLSSHLSTLSLLHYFENRYQPHFCSLIEQLTKIKIAHHKNFYIHRLPLLTNTLIQTLSVIGAKLPALVKANEKLNFIKNNFDTVVILQELQILNAKWQEKAHKNNRTRKQILDNIRLYLAELMPRYAYLYEAESKLTAQFIERFNSTEQKVNLNIAYERTHSLQQQLEWLEADYKQAITCIKQYENMAEIASSVISSLYDFVKKQEQIKLALNLVEKANLAVKEIIEQLNNDFIKDRGLLQEKLQAVLVIYLNIVDNFKPMDRSLPAKLTPFSVYDPVVSKLFDSILTTEMSLLARQKPARSFING
jgi:hypothetical protein